MSQSEKASSKKDAASAAFGARSDGWKNIFSNLGSKTKDARTANQFVYNRSDQLFTRDYLDGFYAENALYARLVDEVPDLAFKRWVKFTAKSSSGENLDEFGSNLIEDLDAMGVRSGLLKAVKVDRKYGGAGLLLRINDGQPVDQPLNEDRIISFDGFSVLSPFQLFPQEHEKDPLIADFQDPSYYLAFDRSDRIHPSRVIRMVGQDPLADEPEDFRGYGLPMLSRLHGPISKYDTSFDYAEAMMKDIITSVMKITGLAQMLARDCDDQILKRLELIATSSSVFNMIVLDGEEDFEKRAIPMSGVDDLLLRFMDYLSGATGLPHTVLFGQSPGGLSTDDESGQKQLSRCVGRLQEQVVRPALERIVSLKVRSQDSNIPDVESWKMSFVPFEDPDESKVADTKQKEANTDAVLIREGVLSPEEARSRHLNDSEAPYTLSRDSPDGADLDDDDTEI